MELASCIPYAQGHPRTIGVSAGSGLLRELFGRLTNNNNYYRSVSITISEGSPYKISIVGVGPIDIYIYIYIYIYMRIVH